MELVSNLTRQIMEVVNTHDHNNGIDFGAHISSIDPISSSLLGASLFPNLPHPMLGSTVSSSPRFSTVVNPEVLVIRMQGASNLPDSVEMLQQVKAVWYTTLAGLLEI